MSGAAALWLTLLFSYAGSLKILHNDLAAVIAEQDILPRPLRPLVPRWLPTTEIALALTLAYAATRPIGAALSLGFALALALLAAHAIRRGLRVPCGCTGVESSETIGTTTLARSTLMAASACLILLLRPEGPTWLALAGGVAAALASKRQLLVSLRSAASSRTALGTQLER
jgi:hypothetical protein